MGRAFFASQGCCFGFGEGICTRVIGITGGVGAGKSQVLSYIEGRYRCRVIRADEAAHLLEEPGQVCYKKLVGLLGRGILNDDGTIDKGKMADIIFKDKKMLEQVNAVIHPEVKKYILGQIDCEREKGEADYFFIEAALLIEGHYGQIVDELWYIYSEESVRRKRLEQSRQYSAEKIADIMRGQLSEEEFRAHCKVVISNNGELGETYKQIELCLMGEMSNET